MAIIYSYPKQTVLQNTDLLIGTRFSTDPGVVPRSISFSIETLTEHINASATIPTLDQVLNEGNVSLLDAQVGSIYLYDDFTVPGYLSIRGFKDRVYFYSKSDKSYGYITQNSLVLKDELSDYHFTIKKANSIESNHTATFQDATGTVAYLDDLLALNLDQVLDNGNVSLNDAYIGDIYLFDTSNDAYGYISSNSEQISFFNSNNLLCGSFNRGSISIDDPSSPFVMNLTVIPLSDSRSVALPDKTGTVALLSDIPAVIPTANYGLFAQTENSTTIVNTNSELSLIGTGLGSLEVPADNFKVGDSFRASLMGHISCLGSATLQIKVKTWNGASYGILADTGIIDLDPATGQHWNLDIDFTIRAIGSFEDGSIVSGGSFYYNKGNGNIDLRNFVTENNTTFDTESNNELIITAQFNNASASNSIYSNLFTLTKTY